jgi:HAD superfamily hydrolase (TIGR01509 family)
MPPAALIFDMDGLMLDTEPLGARAWDDAARATGIPFDASVTPRLIGRTFTDCRALILDHHGGCDYPIDELMAGWHAAYDAIVEREGIALKAGLVELLDWLEGAGIPRAVATSTRRARAQEKLERTGLWPRFAGLVGGDEVANGKPAPDIFLAAARLVRAPPAACLVLEDSIAGLTGAAAAGMPSVMVPDLCDPPAEVAGRPPRVMRSLHEVRDWLAAGAP